MANQRQLNDGKQGSGSGLDADFTDGKNAVDLKSELGKNVSLNDYRSWQNQIVSGIAENNFENGLTQLGYPDGFYDVFVNQDKISSSTSLNITTGTSGNLKLSKSAGTTATRGADNNSASNSNKRGLRIEANTDLISVTGKISSNTAGVTSAYIYDDTGTLLAEKDISSLSAGDTFTFDVSLTSGNKYDFVLDDNGNSYTMGYYDSANLPQTSQNIDIVSGVQAVGSYFSGSAYNILEVTASDGFTQTGSLTSTTQDKGYSATQATLTADYALNGQSIDSIDLFDGGTNLLASWTESEIGTTKTVSTSRTDYYAEVNLSGDGTDTPQVNKFEMGLDN